MLSLVMTPADDDPDANDASGGCFVAPGLISGCSNDRCSKILKNNNIPNNLGLLVAEASQPPGRFPEQKYSWAVIEALLQSKHDLLHN